MRWRRDLAAFFLAYGIGQGHEGRGVRLLKILCCVFREDRRRKRAKDFPMLDPAVQNLLHFQTARVGDDALIAKGARPPFGAALKPIEDFSVCDERGAAPRQLFFCQFDDGTAALCQAIRIDCSTNFLTRRNKSSSGARTGPRRFAISAENILPSVGVLSDSAQDISGPVR